MICIYVNTYLFVGRGVATAFTDLEMADKLQKTAGYTMVRVYDVVSTCPIHFLYF